MGPMSAGQPSALRSRCSDGVAAWGISAEIAHGRRVPPVHSSVLPALSGPHYSIAAGKWSEPAEERQRRCGPQGGPTPVAVLRYWACIELRRWFSFSVVRPLWGRRWWMHLSAGSLCSPRGYRVVRPRWGRCLRGSRPRCVRAVLMAWLGGAFPRKSLMAAAYLWCVRRVCRPYRGRTIL